METLIVNLIGGPSSGKSTMAAGLFYELKRLGHSVELVTEFAKELTWEERIHALSCQAYIFGKQYHRIDRLVGKVEIVITDTSILYNPIYQPDHYPASFEQCVVDMYKQQHNLTINVNRVFDFEISGRNQTKVESELIDEQLKALMLRHKIDFVSVDGNESGLFDVLTVIKSQIHVH